MALDLKTWREKVAKITQKKLAEDAGSTPVSISRYENHKRLTIRAKLIFKFFELSGGEVTPNDLYGITPELIAQTRAKAAEKLLAAAKENPHE